jgi:hypothetical protein
MSAGAPDMQLDDDEWEYLSPEEQEEISKDISRHSIVHAYVRDQETNEYIDARGRHDTLPNLWGRLGQTRFEEFPGSARELINITAHGDWDEVGEKVSFKRGQPAFDSLAGAAGVKRAQDYAVKYLGVEGNKNKAPGTGQQGVAEGAPIVVAQAPIDVRNPKKAPQPYRNKGDIVPDTKPPSTEKRGVKGRPGQRPMPKYDESAAMTQTAKRLTDPKDGAVAKLRAAGDKRREDQLKSRDIAKKNEAFSQAAADQNKIKYQKSGRIGHGLGWKDYTEDPKEIVDGIVHHFDNITRMAQYDLASDRVKLSMIDRFFKKYGYPFELMNDVIVQIERKLDAEYKAANAKETMLPKSAFAGSKKNKLGPTAHLKGKMKRPARAGDLVGDAEESVQRTKGIPLSEDVQKIMSPLIDNILAKYIK